MAKYRGQDIVVFTQVSGGSYKAIAYGTSCDFVSQCELIEVASPNTGEYATYKAKKKSWAVSSNHLLSTENKADILAMLGQEVTVVFEYNETPSGGTSSRTHNSSNALKSGTAICTKVSISAKNRDFVTASMEFQGSGTLT